MTYSESAPAVPRRIPGLLAAGLVIAVATITLTLGHQLLTSSSSTAAAPVNIPALANLDPDLFQALREARTDAAGDGVELHVNSGWRSPEYQDRLLREAVSEYGSQEEAARWVATSDTSPHVSGDAIDVGPSEAATWLSEHGSQYKMCQIYGNEPWHYELRSDAVEHGCPAMYPDPTHDPRMQP